MFAWLMLTLAGADARPADLVVYANVRTVEPSLPTAEAFAVRGGRFVAVGSVDAVRPLIGPNTTVWHRPTATAVPGFIDAHCHPTTVYPDDSRWATVDVSPDRVRSMDELIAALKKKADATPPGLWVTGGRYQETKLGRHPTRHDLDKASAVHPIVISHSSGHLSACNSLALKQAKVTRDTPDPPGGAFERDANGEPTGLLKEGAAGLVRAAGPPRETPPADEQVAAYRRGFRRFHAKGMTGIHVAGTDPRTADLLTRAAGDDAPIRIYVMLRDSHRAETVRRKASPTPLVRYGAIKLFHGNSLSGQTCWLSRPYEGRPDYFGIPPGRSQRQLDELIANIHADGLQACVHCNGDREIDMVLNAFAAALEAKPVADHRHRLEHCSVVTPAILQRIKSLNLAVAPHSYVFEHGDKMEAYGESRFDWMHPNRSLIDQGTPVAGNSDFPVSAADPLLRIQDMVTRTSAEGKLYGPSQRTTAEQALRAWTFGGAFASFSEAEVGTIAVGKFADFVVLADDPCAVPAGRIKDIAVLTTVVGGRVVHEARP